MRKFSDKEKHVIRSLVEGASQSFTYLPINAYGDIFHREQVEFVYRPTPELRFYAQQSNLRSSDEIFAVTGEIYEISYLIDYLEKEGLIRHFSVGTGNLINSISGFSKTGLVAISVSLDPSVGQMLYNNLNCSIYVTQTLISLVHNNFQTLEEQSLDEAKKQTSEAKRQSRLSMLTMVLALLTLLFSLLQGCNGCSRNNESNDSTSGEVTIPVADIINYMRNNIEGKLDATMNNTADISLMIKDTIIVKVASCPCKPRRVPVLPVDSCQKKIRINTCEDTVVSKKVFPIR